MEIIDNANTNLRLRTNEHLYEFGNRSVIALAKFCLNFTNNIRYHNGSLGLGRYTNWRTPKTFVAAVTFDSYQVLLTISMFVNYDGMVYDIYMETYTKYVTIVSIDVVLTLYISWELQQWITNLRRSLRSNNTSVCKWIVCPRFKEWPAAYVEQGHSLKLNWHFVNLSTEHLKISSMTFES